MVGGQGNRMFPLDGVGSRLSPEDIRRWLTNTAQMEDALPKAPAIKMSTRKSISTTPTWTRSLRF